MVSQIKRSYITKVTHFSTQMFAKSVVKDYARDQGWNDTHTGGYNPQANRHCEARIGKIKKSFRKMLLTATQGKSGWQYRI